MIKIIVTGMSSFIGSKFVENILLHTAWEVYSIERLSSSMRRLGALAQSTRLHHLYHDLLAEVPLRIVQEVGDASYLVHFAADVSGIKSLNDPVLSVKTNVLGTFNTLELARKLRLSKFIYISTGEVVGRVPSPKLADESAPLRPSNPYAAGKAAGETLANAYRVSYNVPTIIIRSMNVFGPKQQITRFIPMTIKNLLDDQKITCHVNEHGVPGSRNWLHVDKFADMIEYLLEYGQPSEIYHVVGPEKTNYEVIQALASALKRSFHFENVVAGSSHDLRYALKDTKLGFKPNEFELEIVQTAQWYVSNRVWLT